MSRESLIDASLGAVVIASTAAGGVISGYLAPPAWRGTLYGLCGGVAVLTTAGVLRSIRRANVHDRTLSQLRDGHAYLSQPESHRQIDMIWQRHEAMKAAEIDFQENFEINSRDAAFTRVRCKHCNWEVQKALLYAREDAMQHFRAWHQPPDQPSPRWRRLLRV